MINTIEQYLAELKKELVGSDRTTVQDALADAEEYLRAAMANAKVGRKPLAAEKALAEIIEKYGSPKEIAAAYVDLSKKHGPIARNKYDFTDFTGIKIGHAFELVVIPSDNYSIAITAGEHILEHINVHQDGTTLVFDVDDWVGLWFSRWMDILFSSRHDPRAIVTVTMPVIKKLELSGASRANISGFESQPDFTLVISGASRANVTGYESQQNFTLDLSGASTLDIDAQTGDFTAAISGASHVSGLLVAASTSIKISGASNIKLNGYGGDVELRGSGASTANLKKFSVDDANVGFSGASHLILAINGQLDGELNGASSLEYIGNPRLGRFNKTGASKMKQTAASNMN